MKLINAETDLDFEFVTFFCVGVRVCKISMFSIGIDLLQISHNIIAEADFLVNIFRFFFSVVKM